MDQDLYECSVCLGPFNKPKLIDCHHTFCLSCLENLVDHNSSRIFIRCPLCNKRSKIPEGGVANFTTNFYIEKPANQRLNQVLCKNHPDVQADSYCKGCKIALCSKCILRNHRDHTILDLECEESTSHIVQEFSNRKEKMEDKVEEFQIFQTILEDKSCELDDFAAHTIKDVQRHVENVCAIIKDMGANVVQEIEQNLDINQKKLKMLRKEVEMINSNMAQKVREMEKSLKHQKTLQIVETMADLEDSGTSSTEFIHSKISLPDIFCLSFVESQNKIDMDTIGILVQVQSPLMVTGFEELLTDHQLKQQRKQSTNSQEPDCLLYMDEPENNSVNLLGAVIPSSTISQPSDSIDKVTGIPSQSPDQLMEIERDMDKPILERKSHPISIVKHYASAIALPGQSADLTTSLDKDKPIPGYTEVVVNVKDFCHSYECPVINGVTWGITTKRLGNMLCLYLDLPIEGNLNINNCHVDCQLSIENKNSDLTIRRQVENRKFEPGEDCGVSFEISWQSLADPDKNYILNDLLTVGIFMKYQTIKYHK